jgi:hypothetical protein
MTRQFELLRACQWDDCDFRFRWKTCGSYANHVTEHLQRTRSNRCLWRGCHRRFDAYEELAFHISDEHGAPNHWTMLTAMRYCYEHDTWCRSEQEWVHHIKTCHAPQLNDFCGLIRLSGVVVVAAHCLFCLGDEKLPITERFQQFPDVFVLHKHMKRHLDLLDTPMSLCPHPRCDDQVESDRAFWTHAHSVHGTPPFATCTAGTKRRMSDSEVEEDSDMLGLGSSTLDPAPSGVSVSACD